MSESTRILIIFILAIILLLTVSFFGSTLLMKRALKSVIKSFRDFQALTPETAKMAFDLGFKRRGLLQIRGFRDYKPAALQFLQKQDIVLVTEDGRLYLSEQTLLTSGIESRLAGKK